MNYLALDIGGANLKLADGKGFSVSRPFPLWQQPERLSESLSTMFAEAPPAERLTVTMTGELADCFATKAEGVLAILDAVELAAADRKIAVYLCDGRLVELEVARGETLLAAASNWHVLAGFAGRFCGGKSGLLIDIGSTTADLIPIGPAGPQAVGRTDPERLVAGELVYTGVQRSPVCSVVRELSWRGESCPVAQEVFATTLDAYLLLGELAEDVDDFQTTDGKAHTRANALVRLARMICADVTMFSREDGKVAAEVIREAQLAQLEIAAKRVLGRMKSPPETIVVSGQGEFLARHLVKRLDFDGNVISLTQGQSVGLCPCFGRYSKREGWPVSRSLIRIVKVGGSLLELPDLADRLRRWLAIQTPAHHVLVAGGGRLVEQIRQWHALRPLSNVAAHWMCIDAMTVTAHMLHDRLPEIALIEDDRLLCQRVGFRDCTIFGPALWMRHGEPSIVGTKLPSSWEVTSDAIAGRLAVALDADELVLMKSSLPAESTSGELSALSTAGYVDPMLPRLAGELPPYRLVNLRGTPALEIGPFGGNCAGSHTGI